MLKSKLYVVMLILGMFALLGVSCTKPVPSTEPTPTDVIEDIMWILESYGEPRNLQTVLEGTEITALFDSTEGQVRGSAGANNYFGSYQISKNKVSIQQIAHTEMYRLDPEGVMEQEQQYLKALQVAESYEIMDGKLRITCGAEVLIFVAKQE